MLTPKQIRVFEAFMRKPYKGLTYRDIKEYSKEKSNSGVQKAVARFLSDDLIIKTEVGNNYVYFANLKNTVVFSYFGIMVKEIMPSSVIISLRIVKEELSSIGFKSIVIFGSYADGKHREKSDLDIAVFVNSQEDKRTCSLALKTAGLKSLLQIDAHVFTRDEMLLMLKDRHENLGKQIACKHIAVCNPEIFYSILQEGIENGFKVVYP